MERKAKKNTFSLLSDLDVESFLSTILIFPQLHEHVLIKANSNVIFIKIYKEASLFAHYIKGLKVNFLNICHTAVYTFY